MARRRGKLRIGTSGYQYDDWRGRFYPPELPRSAWLAYYAERFEAVEINATFYRLPEAATFERWRDETPAGFCCALKFSRYGSHLKRLQDPSSTIDHFLQRARLLGPKLGPILVQLPPRWRVNPARLAEFLDAAPEAQRWAVEFRDPSWLCEEVYAVLRQHGAALCVHDMIENHPRIQTSDWTYLRFHGDAHRGSYSPQALSATARRLRPIFAEGEDVYVFFNNDIEGHAVHDAAALRRYLCSQAEQGARAKGESDGRP